MVALLVLPLIEAERLFVEVAEQVERPAVDVGAFVWEGMVEVFAVDTQPPAVAYGWAMKGDQGPQYVAVKDVPSADFPLAAVRVWLVSQSKK